MQGAGEMAKYGFLIDYSMCIGCRGCEIACNKEHSRPAGESGIVVRKVDAEENNGKPVFFPFYTEKCNLCGKRIAKGLKPACVHSCWGQVIEFGKIEDLAVKIAEGSRKALITPR